MWFGPVLAGVSDLIHGRYSHTNLLHFSENNKEKLVHVFFGIFVNFYCLNIIFLVALENLIYKWFKSKSY